MPDGVKGFFETYKAKLGKLFRSILNQRLLERVMSLNTLHHHKSQIGILPNNRTADHVWS